MTNTPYRPPLSPAAQTVNRDLAQIMQELSKYCRVSISATDILPITLETNDTSLEAGINALCAAALRACNDWRIDTEVIYGVEYIRITTLEKIAAELEAYQ